MKRYTGLLVLIAAVLMSAAVAAQDAGTVRRIEIPLSGAYIALSPDGVLLAAYVDPIWVNHDTAPEILPILLYDVATGEQIGALDGAQNDLTTSAAFSPDGRHLASYHTNGTLIIWDVATRTALSRIDWLPIGSARIHFTPDGENIVILSSVSQIGQQIIFDLSTESITGIFWIKPETMEEFMSLSRDITQLGDYMVNAQAVSDAGVYGATANGDVFIWDESGERITIYPTTEERPLSLRIRLLQPVAEGVAFYDVPSAQTVIAAPDGATQTFPFGSPQFAISDTGLLAYYERSANQIFIVALDESAAPQPLGISLETGERITPQTSLLFTPDGDLVIGGTDADGSSGAYIVDLP